MKRNSPKHVPPDRGGESHDAPSSKKAHKPEPESTAVSVTGATGESKVENLEGIGQKISRGQVHAGVIYGDVHIHIYSSSRADKGRHDRYEADRGDVVPCLLEEKDSGEGDTESVSDAVSEGGHRSDTEGRMPHLMSKWVIQEDNMKLIYYYRNHMLNEACREGKLEIVKNILSTGSADINNKSQGGWTPVLLAAKRGQQDIFNVLVKKKCNLLAVLDNGNNILHVACFGGNTDIIEYLTAVVSIDSKGMYGRTAVMKAAAVGNKNVFYLLVSKGCNLSAVDDIGNSILHLACFGGNVHIVEYLITHKIADIESRSLVGRTPVMFAAAMGKQQVFYLLVGKGCNLSAVDDIGNNILHLACFSDNVHIVEYLITHKIADKESQGQIGRTPVMTAAVMGKQQVFDLLAGKGCDLSAVDDTGNNILHLACVGGNVHIVEYLITHKIADIESRGQFGRTPVMFAAEMGKQQMFDLLVGKGCNLSAVDDTGNNILHLATRRDRRNCQPTSLRVSCRSICQKQQR